MVGRYDTPDNVGHGYLLSNGVLTTIDVPDSTFSVATGINPSGHIVGRYRSTDGVLHGFLLVDGEFTTIDYPGASAMNGIAINAKGEIAGYYADADGKSHGFLLIDGVFTSIDPPGALSTGGGAGIIGINLRDIVGSYRVAPATLPCGCDGGRAFVFRNGSYATFALPDSLSTGYTGINSRGDIVGTYLDSAGRLHGLLVPRGFDE